MEFAGSKFAEHPDGDGLICKAAKKLVQIDERVQHGQERVIYQAATEDCAGCEWRSASVAENEERRGKWRE